MVSESSSLAKVRSLVLTTITRGISQVAQLFGRLVIGLRHFKYQVLWILPFQNLVWEVNFLKLRLELIVIIKLTYSLDYSFQGNCYLVAKGGIYLGLPSTSEKAGHITPEKLALPAFKLSALESLSRCFY